MLRKIFYSVSLLLVLYIIANIFLFNDSSKLSYLKSKIPIEKKQIIKKYFFPYRYIDETEKYSKALQEAIDDNQKLIKDIESDLNKKDKLLSQISEKLGYTRFYEIKNQDLRVKNKVYNFKEFKDDFLEIKKHGDARSGSIYVEKDLDKIIILTASGIFQFFNTNDLQKREFYSKVIPSNLKKLIKYENFFSNSNYGVKGLLIFNNYLYFSFNREVIKGCFNTSILRAKLNYENLNFEKFFFPDECVKKDSEGFTPHSAGGRMVIYKNKIIFSSGEYLKRRAAQDPNSILGKILLLDPTKPGSYDLISLGHRNVQGLHVDKINNTIISTEHGPMGGDEVNVNINFLSEKKNFGWPISSYGEHYGFSKRNDSHPLYIEAPLYKSHKDHGFYEPIKYYVPSIGISEIVKLSKEMSPYEESHNFMLGALGSKPSEGDMSLHFLEISNDYSRIRNHDVVNINSRVRDILTLNDNNVLVMLETDSTIGLLTLKE